MKKLMLLSAVISSLCFFSNLSYAQTPDWLWAKGAGGTDNDIPQSVAVDASGNPYMAGWFKSPTITFGSYTLTNTGGEDVFLVKYDAGGDVLWAKSAVGTVSDYAHSIAVDASGNAYVAGRFTSPTITFGSFTLTNAGGLDCYNIFLVKYDANGNVLWAKSAGGGGNDYAYAVAVDVSGNAYVTGFFKSPAITFGSTTLTNTGSEDFFLTKYDANGNVLWAKCAVGTAPDGGYTVAVDASGNPYVAGWFDSPTITFGTITLTNVGNNDMFLVKYDANGNVLWAKGAGGTTDDYSLSVAVDASGNSFVTGWFDSPTITFGTSTLTNAGNNDMFLVKYDANGNVLWAKSAGGTADDFPMSVTVDASGNPYVAGDFVSPTITFGSTTLSNNGMADMFLAKYDASGNGLWAISTGGTAGDCAWSVALDAWGIPYVAGSYYSSTITFGSTTLTNTGGGGDIFLAKLESSTTGMIELSNPLNISVFPNPAKDILTVETLTKGSFSILNLNGQELINIQVTEPKIQIDITGLSSGVYFVRLKNDKTVEVGRFIKE
ncbi:MAG: SBBP repeat-containing protein [Bacteroidetes bacterium]|nr:SBBP repeat-containing protein [Bacteroidota bacterium]